MAAPAASRRQYWYVMRRARTPGPKDEEITVSARWEDASWAFFPGISGATTFEGSNYDRHRGPRPFLVPANQLGKGKQPRNHVTRHLPYVTSYELVRHRMRCRLAPLVLLGLTRSTRLRSLRERGPARLSTYLPEVRLATPFPEV